LIVSDGVRIATPLLLALASPPSYRVIQLKKAH
jgi:hypothetical protein